MASKIIIYGTDIDLARWLGQPMETGQSMSM
jgi:hypothetical protein